MADVKITDNHFEIVSKIENNQEQKQQSVPSILEYRNNHAKLRKIIEDLDDRGIKSHPYWEADPSRNPGGHGKGPGGRQDLYEWIQNEQRNQNMYQKWIYALP